VKDGVSRLNVTLPGGFELTFGSDGSRILPTRKAQALLAYLAVEPGRRSSREELAMLLWGDRRDIQARRSLRQAVYALSAELLAGQLGDRERLCRVLTLSTNTRYLLGNYDHALTSARRALAIAAELGDEGLAATVNLFVGQIYYPLGELTAATELLQRALDHGAPGQRLGVAGRTVAARLILCWCLSSLGRFDEGVVCGREARDVAKGSGRPSSLVAAYLGLVIPYAYRGEFREAVELGEQALALCETIEAPLLLPMVQAQLGHAYMLAGRGPMSSRPGTARCTTRPSRCVCSATSLSRRRPSPRRRRSRTTGAVWPLRAPGAPGRSPRTAIWASARCSCASATRSWRTSISPPPSGCIAT
jgi:tetratricopeptide (TPR) repeat protein